MYTYFIDQCPPPGALIYFTDFYDDTKADPLYPSFGRWIGNNQIVLPNLTIWIATGQGLAWKDAKTILINAKPQP